jgi:hypothetical protein
LAQRRLGPGRRAVDFKGDSVMMIHVRLWSLFPFWYHLVFLATLIPLVVLGSRLTRARPLAGATAGGAGT